MSVYGYTDDEYEPDDQPTLISRLDVSNPLHLNPNDFVALIVMSIKLKGTKNYQVWSCVMLLALEGKNKTGSIDGVIFSQEMSCRMLEMHMLLSLVRSLTKLFPVLVLVPPRGLSLLCLILIPGCEVGESSAAATARQPGPTIETRLRDTERRIMTAIELVNRTITYQVDVCIRESSEFCTQHHDAQKDRAAVRAEIEDLRDIKMLGIGNQKDGLYYFNKKQDLNLCGPYKVTSKEEFKYFLTLVDDYTRAVWVYLIKTKDENGIVERKHRHLLNVCKIPSVLGGITFDVMELNHSNFFDEVDGEIPYTPYDEERVVNSPNSEGSNSFHYGSPTIDQDENEGVHSLGSNGSAIGNEMAAMVAFRHFRDAFSVVFGLSLTQDTVMSDSEDSTVTYTAVSSPFGGLSDIGSPGVDRPPVMPKDPYAYVVAAFQALPSPDYVSGPEYPPLPDFVPEPVYPEFMPPEDEALLAEEQPLPATVSPTADSPGYVPESDLEEDPEEDDDEDPEEDPADYLADRGDDGDDEDESSDDDKDDDVDIEGDEEEEEHPAPADSTTVALPAVDQAPSAEETEPFEIDESAATPPPHPAYRFTARILLAISSPPPSPRSPWSSPLNQIPLPPLPVSPLPLPVSPTYLLVYRATMIRLRAEAPSTSHSPQPHIILSHTRADTQPSGTPPLLPILLPTSSPPLHLLSTDHRADRPDVTLPPRKRLGIALGLRYKVGESSSSPTTRPPRGFRADYGFVATMDREIMRDLERDVGYGITDTWEEMLVDMSGVPATNETELVRTTVLGQQAVITELQAADHRRQVAIIELLAADCRRQAQFIKALKLLKRLQTQMTEFKRQQGPAKGPAQPDAPEEAGSSS
ncbi:reverse transcriptase domain-containing protein [Tanacetum coccineum]